MIYIFITCKHTLSYLIHANIFVLISKQLRLLLNTVNDIRRHANKESTFNTPISMHNYYCKIHALHHGWFFVQLLHMVSNWLWYYRLYNFYMRYQIDYDIIVCTTFTYGIKLIMILWLNSLNSQIFIWVYSLFFLLLCCFFLKNEVVMFKTINLEKTFFLRSDSEVITIIFSRHNLLV